MESNLATNLGIELNAVINEAKRLFNETWDLIEKPDRSAEDDALMLHKTHASCLLWREADRPLNNARGEWQVSHVYSILGYGEPALLHARLSLNLCLDNSIGDFDLAFGYEAMARAYNALGDKAKALEYKNLGIAACDNISEDGEKTYTLGELNNINIQR